MKPAEGESDVISPLPFVFELLLAKSVSPGVIDAIMTLVENLLVTSDFKVTDDDKVIDTGVTIKVDKQGRGMLCQSNCRENGLVFSTMYPVDQSQQTGFSFNSCGIPSYPQWFMGKAL